jgi:glycosyltransferase involved in cell wall biosynthesis
VPTRYDFIAKIILEVFFCRETTVKKMQKPRILFLNQMAGPLFRELAEDISQEWSPSLLFTGHPDTLKHSQTASLHIIAAPTYQRRNYVSRILSWIQYFICVLIRCWRQGRGALLFIVSNPPFIGIIGYLFKRLRGQRYVVLIYDITPDAMITHGPLKESGLITRLWRRMNRLVWENAEIVFTLSDPMASNLERWFDVCKTRAGKVIVIPNWADVDWIRPMAKDTNEFARKYMQTGKLTVMYSGNLGQSHDIETILNAAKRLKGNDAVRFMIIGDGARRNLVEKTKREDGLDNLTVLPFQPENILPVLLATADLAVISLDKGSEGLMVPSKTYYSMAAGAALIGLCDKNCEVARIISRYECGIVVTPGDIDAMTNGIIDLLGDKSKLNHYRANSRIAAEKFYSRKNTSQYLEALATVIPSEQ